MIGKRVLPRRYARCFQCKEQTIQWLYAIDTGSPGSYRGTRLYPNYICTQCGVVEI